VAVGVIGAQSLGEPATQLAVSSVKAGTAIGAKSDITTGLPRVEEVLEARVPKYVAQVAKFDGEVVKVSGSLDQGYNIMIKSITNIVPLLTSNIKDANWLIKDAVSGIKVESGQSLAIDDTGESIITPITGILQIGKDGSLVVEQDSNHTEIYTTSASSYLTVKVGSKVITGTPLTDGSLDLQQICDAQGIDGVMDYIVKEINSIYISNGIDVDEKHIELVVRQMTLKSVIIDSGDSELIIGDVVKTANIKKINQDLIKSGKNPAQYKVTVCGISRASLATDSFLSAASFQETSRVLVEATLSSCRDNLLGLKENVILGQLIPCGTGFIPELAAKISDTLNEFDELEVVSIEE
jgi:DNA-directed RNA polymerase subunit beta'